MSVVAPSSHSHQISAYADEVTPYHSRDGLSQSHCSPANFSQSSWASLPTARRGAVSLIGIYFQMIHDFLDGRDSVINEPRAARRIVSTPILFWRGSTSSMATRQLMHCRVVSNG